MDKLKNQIKLNLTDIKCSDNSYFKSEGMNLFQTSEPIIKSVKEKDKLDTISNELDYSEHNVSMNKIIKKNKNGIKYFDDFEIGILKRNANIDVDFINGFFDFYVREKPYLQDIFEDKYKKIPKSINMKHRILTDDDISTLKEIQDYQSADVKIGIINMDIDNNIPKTFDFLLNALKKEFEIENMNIDLIGYKFSINLKRDNTEILKNGKILLIQIAKSLSYIFNDEESYLQFEKFCMNFLIQEEIKRVSIENEVNKITQITQKAKEKVIYEYFPEKIVIDYNVFNDKMKKYIKSGTPEIYKYIIENKKFPKDTYLQPLTMISESKSDIVRFADCFDIDLKDASIIFNTPVESKNRVRSTRSPFFFLLKSYNSQLYLETKEA